MLCVMLCMGVVDAHHCVSSSICPGDMQLTRSEIDGTQVIVATPEKWDVVTRSEDTTTWRRGAGIQISSHFFL